MTTYLHYIRALKSGVVINDYNYSPMLERLLSLRHVKCFMVLPNTGLGYREYSYEPPVATVQETLTVARIRLADKVRYKDGKRLITPQWTGQAYPVIGSKHGFLLLDTGHGVVGRKAENVKVA